MRYFAATAVFVLVFVTTLAPPAWAAPEGLATSFEANRGQFSPDVFFSHRSRSFDIQVLVGGAVRISSQGRTRVLTLEPVAGMAAEVEGIDALAATANVFVGQREADWITGIPLFEGVLIREASPGVELSLSADGERLVAELRGAPGVDPALLGWAVDGVLKAFDQEAVVDLDGASLRLSPTLLPREPRGKAAPVVGGDVSAGWTLRTVIEVVAPPSAGSPVEDHEVRLALGADGSVFVAGTVERSRGVQDAFVVKLGPDRSSLAWVAYLGGAGSSRLAGLAVTPQGDAVLAGATLAMDFPQDQSIDPAADGLNAFVARVAGDGTSLPFPALLDGEGSEAAEGVASAPDDTTRVAESADADGQTWIAEQTEAGVVVSRRTTDDPDSGRVVARIAALDRPGTVAIAADGAVLIAGSTRGAIGVDPRARLVGPIAGNASAVLVVLPGAPKAPLAAACPGTINFDNSAGTGVWQTAANWDLNVLPGVSDDVCIDGFNVTVPSGTQTVNSVTVTASGSLGISGGTLSLASASQVAGAFSLSAGTLSGSGSLTVSGLATWTGGTMSGAGTTQANGGLAIGGAAGKILNSSRVLNTPGATTWSGTGALNVTAAAVINNTGTWDCQSDAAITGGGAGVAFNNNAPGIFKKSAGAGTTDVNIAFNNSATVAVQTGTLTLDGGGVHSGSFSGSPGTILQFGGGTHALGAASSVNAAAVSLTATAVTFDGSYSVTSSTSVSGGVNTFNPASTVSSVGSSLTISGGTVNFNSGDTIAPTTLSLTGSGTLGGTDAIAVSGPITWTGGTMSGAGTTQANGGLAIGGGAAGKILSSSRVLNTPGATAWSGTGALNVTAAAGINNTGTWDCQSDAAITGGGAGVAFNNNAPGIFKKSAGAGTTTVGIAFNNTGSVQALAGTMRFTAGYLQTAGSTIVNGGTISSTTTMNIQGGVLGGVGTVTANVTSAGTVAPGLSPGALSIAGNYVQSGSGTLESELGGLAAGTQYDRLALNGTGVGTLSGTLNVVFVNGFVPTGAAVFTVLSGVALNGTFATVNLPALSAPLQWRIVYGPTSVVAEVMDDTDGDGRPDPLDCAPLNPGAYAIHGEVPGLVFAGDKQNLSWGLPLPSGGTDAAYDVMRGALNELPVAGGAAEACPAPNVAGPPTQDATTPPAGVGFYYLVRARNVCGAGTYGSATSGAVRVSSVCP